MPKSPPLPTLSPLEQYRLDKDLSYQKLADRIFEVTGVRRDHKTIRKACDGGPVYDRTEHAIAKFLRAPKK